MVFLHSHKTRSLNLHHLWLTDPYVRCGSKAPFWQSVGHFRSTPINRRVQSPSACLKGANNRTRPYERSSCTVRHANASRLAIVAYQAQGCGADVFFLRRCIRAYTAVGVRFSFRAISRAVIPVSSISRSCPSSEPVHGRPAGLGPVISSPYPRSRPDDAR